MVSTKVSCALGALLVLCLSVPAFAKTGDATWYNGGMTACGRVVGNNELAAAVAFGYFTTPNPNLDPICGRLARVRDPATGNSVEVRIFDKCYGCTMNDIDLLPAAFQKLRPLDTGRFKVDWDFI